MQRHMHALFASTFAGGLLALASWTAPQQPRPDLRARLSTAFGAVAERGEFTDLAAGVWLGQQVVFAGSSARSEEASRESLDQPRSAPWALEPFAALALLRLADQDRLELDDALTEHLPELKFGGKEVSVAQVLTHSSGIPSYLSFIAVADVEASRGGVLTWLAERPLDAAPGSCFAYSESNALIAAELVEKVSGRPLQKALQELVFEPAGMLATTLELGSAERRAHGAALRIGGATKDANSLALLLGLAEFTTTLDDLARLMRALEGDLLSPQTRRELTNVDRRVGDGAAPYAFGFHLAPLERGPCLSLAGTARAGTLRIAWHPESSLVVALATKSAGAELYAGVQELTDVVFDTPEREVVDLPLTAEQCAIYAGTYYMGCTRTTIEVRDEQLYFQSPYEGPYRLRFQGGHAFVSAADDEVRFEFTVEDERASEFVMIQHGSRMGAVRMK